jgi:hypothetical protein
VEPVQAQNHCGTSDMIVSFEKWAGVLGTLQEIRFREDLNDQE